MARQIIAQVSQNTLKLQNYLKEMDAGSELMFIDIENSTGITMDTKGKSYLRTALKRSKLEYSPIIGKGIKLADEKTTMPILVNRLTKIDRAVKRADKSQKILQEKFFASLTPIEQKQVLYVGAVFGAIRVAAENGKLIYSSKKQITSNEKLEIPVPSY